MKISCRTTELSVRRDLFIDEIEKSDLLARLNSILFLFVGAKKKERSLDRLFFYKTDVLVLF